MSTELKPCPFCGGSAKPYTFGAVVGGKALHFFECGECRAGKSLGEYSEEEAAKAWNTRAPDPRVEELEEKLSAFRCRLTDMQEDSPQEVQELLAKNFFDLL